MIRAFAHTSMVWLLQLGASSAALLLGPAPWTAGPLLIAYLFLLRAAGQMLAAEAPARARLALGVCVLGQAPGLVLALFVASCIAGVFGEALDSMVLLQFWTAFWAPLISLIPLIWIRDRSAYVWVTLVLPFVQLAWVMAPLLRQLRPHGPAAGAVTGSRSWTPPG